MSNLLRKQRDELLQAELDELEGKTPEQIEQQVIDTPVEDPEEDTFRKRYGDLRRHAARREEELKKEIETLNERVREKTVVLPKTEEELSAWAGKYPDLYKIFETMIIKRESAATEKIKKELERVSGLEADLARERSMKELLRVHPDFEKIAKTEEFHEWLATKSKAIQTIMYEDHQDVNDAIDVVTMYKKTKGMDKVPDKTSKEDTRRKAAEAIPSKTRSAPSFEGEHVFSESEVSAMSEREYLKHEAEITKQMANGKFKYDLSGAAR